MLWIIGGLCLVAMVILLVIWEPGHRGLGQDELASIFSDLVVRFRNGSVVKVIIPKSEVWFSLERISCTADSATVALRVPKMSLSEEEQATLKEKMELAGLTWEDGGENRSLIGTISFRVSRISDAASYYKIAAAAKMFLSYCGVDRNERINIEELGSPLSLEQRVHD